MLSASSEWLTGRLVIELGGRIAVGVCGTLLAQAGATVVFVEPRGGGERGGKFAHRHLSAAGKRSLAVEAGNPQDRDALAGLLARADIVLTSRDWDCEIALPASDLPRGATVCDFTALGEEGDERNLTDVEIQALSGVTHTTGFPDGPPCALRVPVLEYSAGTYGAAACVAALARMRDAGEPQRIAVSLFQCALNALASFLPSVFQGEDPGRFGNGHPIAVPWNAYHSRDGWLMFCSASDAHWTKFCRVIGRPELAADERFRRVADRAANREAVDAIVSDWTRRHDTGTCLALLTEAGLANGEIVPLDALSGEANVLHRRSIDTVPVPGAAQARRIPRSILVTKGNPSSWTAAVPSVDGDREWLSRAEFEPLVGDGLGRGGRARLPFEEALIVEIGQFTTAPLAARHLATYGAAIAKIEPPAGDAAREWAPVVDGTSVFFSMSNSGKTCYNIDLKTAAGLKKLEDLLRRADVLVENMKPGSLSALGLAPNRLMEINPALIYCPISGFGDDSAYANRPAFDTVVQAMSGMMDANAADGTPLKASVSVCDFMGGEVALFAIAAALYGRAAGGRGVLLDLSMQDIAIWMTAGLWDEHASRSPPRRMVRCRDGYVLAGAGDEPSERVSDGLSREEVVALCGKAGSACVPVRTVAEALNSRIAKDFGTVRMHEVASGSAFPVLAPPLTMSPLALRAGTPPGAPRPL